MDKYTNLKVLGEGAFGKVYKAKCKDDGNKYALKRLTVYSGESAELIQKEINALRRVGRHPNIMQYIDSFIGGSRENTMAMYVWLVLEYCNGGTLDSFILSRNLDRTTTLQLLCDMAEGVAYLHGRDIVHRDLKPENILVENSGPRPVVKIADFGLARVCGQTGAVGFDVNRYYMETVAGTLYYWPPEMLRHMLAQQADQVTYTAKIDIWAMGIIIAAILDRMIDPSRPGKLQPVIPVDERVMSVAEAVINYPNLPLADMLMMTMKTQSGIKALALSMLAVDPHRRPTSEQVLRRLKEITSPSNRTKNVQDFPSMPTPTPHNVVEIPAVEGSEPDSENQTSCKDRIACCCAACWRCDPDMKFYHISGKGPGWVIVLLILWAITGAVVIAGAIVAGAVAFVILIVCFPFYCGLRDESVCCCCCARDEIV